MNGPLKGLCVRQPWADALLDPSPDGKRIENRRPGALGWKHRGRLVIIAPIAWAATPALASDDRLRRLWPNDGPGSRGEAILNSGHAIRPRPPFVSSAALGTVDLVDIHPADGCCAPWGEDTYYEAAGPVTDVVHLVTENPFRFRSPITPVSGFLGIRSLAPEVVDLVAAQIR